MKTKDNGMPIKEHTVFQCVDFIALRCLVLKAMFHIK
jgi:hypothetical protein